MQYTEGPVSGNRLKTLNKGQKLSWQLQLAFECLHFSYYDNNKGSFD